MLSLIVDFASIFLAALLAGAMFCMWIILNPAHLDGPNYATLQQQGIRTLQPVLPPLGAITIALTLVAAFFARDSRPRMALLISAAILFIISAIITRAGNMPINEHVLRWATSALPENWKELRDKWLLWHRIRTISGSVGLALLIIASLMRDAGSSRSLASLCGARPLLTMLLQSMSLLF
jgi:uncharacterized membrane protein